MIVVAFGVMELLDDVALRDSIFEHTEFDKILEDISIVGNMSLGAFVHSIGVISSS
jgi:hypothetical protein